MPQCPKCQAVYQEGQRYCDQCESYLLHPEQGNIFCPECGVRVAPGQEFCHKCNGALPAGPSAGQAAPTPKPPEAPRPAAPPPRPAPAPDQRRSGGNPGSGLPGWVYITLGAMGTLILVLLTLLLMRIPGLAPGPTVTPPTVPPAAQPVQPVKPPTPEIAKPPAPEAVKPPEPEAAKPSPPETPPPAQPAKPEAGEVTPPAPETTEPKPEPPKEEPQEAALEKQLEETLNNLREAQLKKDIVLYLSCYSYLFPNLEQKRKDALRYWEKFTFAQLMYSLEDVKEMGEDRAYAKVTWEIQVQVKDSDELEDSTQTFRVGFSKELGKWRIRSLKEVEE